MTAISDLAHGAGFDQQMAIFGRCQPETVGARATLRAVATQGVALRALRNAASLRMLASAAQGV